MNKKPLTIGELIDQLSEYPRNRIIEFHGVYGELSPHRFKTKGKNLEIIEMDDPETLQHVEDLMTELRKLQQAKD